MGLKAVGDALKAALVSRQNIHKSIAIITFNVIAILLSTGNLIALSIRSYMVSPIEGSMNWGAFFLLRIGGGWLGIALPLCFYVMGALLILGFILNIRGWRLKGVNPKMYWQVLSAGTIIGMLSVFVIPVYYFHAWTDIEALIYPILLILPFGFFALSSLIEMSISLFGYH